MEYPLIIDGAQRGVVTCAREGLYTVLEASLPEDPGRGLVRLWAHGEGESVYLGLMQPWRGGLYLKRRFSRSQWAALPKDVSCISNDGSLHNITRDPTMDEKPDEKTEMNLHNTETTAEACPYPAPVSETAGELLWLHRGDGSLCAHDGVSSLLALPTGLEKAPGGAVLRRIEGQNYLVFRY